MKKSWIQYLQNWTFGPILMVLVEANIKYGQILTLTREGGKEALRTLQDEMTNSFHFQNQGHSKIGHI
jgi:hypothetical protein